jgi:flagellar protein FliO/FliZ
MDVVSMLRTLGALSLVLGMLAGALWAVKRYDLKLPGRIASGGRKRVELVERLAVDGKRSVALIRRDGCEHLILIGPEGHATIETGIVAPPAPPPPAPERPAPPPARIEGDLAMLKAGLGKIAALPRQLDFARLVDRAHAAGATEAAEPAPAPQTPSPLARRAVVAANDAEPAAPADPAEPAPSAESDATPRPRTRAPRDTTRWNKRAMREALNG